jgi:hypothetical protein
MERTDRPPERRVWERILDLLERHGDDYLEEGKRLLRRLQRTLVVVAIVAVVTSLAVVALIVYAVLR